MVAFRYLPWLFSSFVQASDDESLVPVEVEKVRQPTFSAPDLFGEARLEVKSPIIGPAHRLQRVLDHKKVPVRTYFDLASREPGKRAVYGASEGQRFEACRRRSKRLELQELASRRWQRHCMVLKLMRQLRQSSRRL
eukprot:g11718.t1